MTTQPEGAVKPASLVRLRAAVRGSSSKPNRLEALDELVDRAPRGLAGFLTDLALDAGAELDVRLSAVGVLGDSRDPAAVEGLVAALRTSDQAVIRRAAQQLGESGGSEHLEDLKAIRTGNSETQQAIRFAKQLISYRHRLDQYRVTVPSRRVRADPGAATQVEVSHLSGQIQAKVEERISEPVLGLHLTTEGARKLTCDGDEFVLLPIRDLVAEGPTTLTEHQAAPAALLERNPETGAFYASHVVLIDPQRGTDVSVHVARSSGVVVLTGSGAIRGDDFTFELATVPTPHLPPTTVVGRFNRDQGIVLDSVVTEARLSPSQLKLVRTPGRQTGPVG